MPRQACEGDTGERAIAPVGEGGYNADALRGAVRDDRDAGVVQW